MVQQNASDQQLSLHMNVGTTTIDGSYFAAEPTHDFHPKSSFHWQTLVNWAINLAEVAAIVGAEIFSAGTATPAIVGIVAGLAATAATTAIDATEGTISYVNLGIGLATSFIPMGSLMRQESKAVTAVANNTEQLSKFIKGVKSGVYQADNDKFLVNIAEAVDTAVQKGTISQAKADKAWKIIWKLQKDPRIANDEVTLARLVATRFISKRALTEELKELGGLTRKVTTAEVKSLGARGTRVLREVTRQQLMNEAEGDLAKGIARISHMENLMDMVVSGEFRRSYRQGLRFFERGPEYVKNAIRKIFPEATETELASYIRPGYFKKLNAAMTVRNEAKAQLDRIEEYLTTQYPDTWKLGVMETMTAGEYSELTETEIMPEIITKKRGRGTINPDGTKVFTPESQLNVGETFSGANNVPNRILEIGKDPSALHDLQFGLTDEQKAASMLYGHPVLIMRQLKQAAGYMSEENWNTMFAQFMLSLDNIDKMAIDKILKSTGKYGIDNFSQVFARAASLDQKMTGTSVVKYMGSHTFNKGPKDLKWRDVKNWKQFRQKAFTVQHFQLVDPNDAGRAIPEALYQAAQEKFADKIRFSKQFKAAQKTVKTSNKILKAFEKSGGRVWPQQGPKRYIIGHKVIKQPSVAGEPYLVLIIFDKINTAPKTIKKRENVIKAAHRHQNAGRLSEAATLFSEANKMSTSFRNTGGKKDIMILATEKDLIGFETEGTAYWFRHGRGRGWYASRGGRRAGKFGSIQLGSTLSLFLGFAPIGAVKNVGSIITNWIENTNDMIKGRYSEQWTKKFVASFENTLYKRSGRLASRVVLGGVIKKGLADKTGLAAFVGNNAPRELQRFTSIFLTNLGGKDSQGNFAFKAKGASTWTRGIEMGVFASTRSAEMRKARSQAHVRGLTSYATELNSTSRKMQVIRRTPGTLTPNTMFNPRSFGRIKVK